MYYKEKQMDPVSFVVDRTDFDRLIYRNQKGIPPVLFLLVPIPLFGSCIMLVRYPLHHLDDLVYS